MPAPTVNGDTHLAPYRAVVARVSQLAISNEGRIDELVPSCPAWTVRAVVSHLAGLAEDWVDGRLDNYGTATWTELQIGRFAGRPIADVLAAWSTAAERFHEIDDSPMGGTPSIWAFGDAIVHEADVGPVLAAGYRVPHDPMVLGLKAAVARWRGELASAGVAPLRIIAPDLREWAVGRVDAESPTVTAPAHELFRGLFGRRSRAQVEQWSWSCDPGPYLDAGLPFPFHLASSDVID